MSACVFVCLTSCAFVKSSNVSNALAGSEVLPAAVHTGVEANDAADVAKNLRFIYRFTLPIKRTHPFGCALEK